VYEYRFSYDIIVSYKQDEMSDAVNYLDVRPYGAPASAPQSGCVMINCRVAPAC